jgi:hypothetical protein
MGCKFGFAVALALLLLPAGSFAAPGESAPVQSAAPDASHAAPKAAKPKTKRAARRVPKGYGFLPGYRAPLVRYRIARERYLDEIESWEPPRYWDYGIWRYGWGWPGFYRGRWNGGSFGPCWTQTPIGPMWNCGK